MSRKKAYDDDNDDNGDSGDNGDEDDDDNDDEEDADANYGVAGCIVQLLREGRRQRRNR